MSNKRVQALANQYNIKYAGIFDWFKREKKTPESRQPTAEETSLKETPLITDIMASQKARCDLGLDTTGRGTGIPNAMRDEYERLLKFYKKNPKQWTLYDAVHNGNDDPANYNDKLDFYKEKLEDPRYDTINDLSRLTNRSPSSWRELGEYLKGWSVEAVDKLRNDLKNL